MLKILVVDDSFFLRAALKLQLKALGCEVVGEASNPEEAVERFRSLRPDVVTLDVVLDPGSGIQIAKTIIAEFPDAKILMVSAVGQEAIMEEAQAAGASGYVMKPVEMPDLKKALGKITGGAL